MALIITPRTPAVCTVAQSIAAPSSWLFDETSIILKLMEAPLLDLCDAEGEHAGDVGRRPGQEESRSLADDAIGGTIRYVEASATYRVLCRRCRCGDHDVELLGIAQDELT